MIYINATCFPIHMFVIDFSNLLCYLGVPYNFFFLNDLSDYLMIITSYIALLLFFIMEIWDPILSLCLLA